VASGRDYRTLTIDAPEGLAKLDRICSLQILSRLESGEIERRIAYEKTYGPEPLSGVPLGGIGTGKLELCADGIFRNISINGNIDTPVWRSEASFFAIHTESETGCCGKLLTKESLYDSASFQNLDYKGTYPQAILSCTDNDVPVNISIKALGPIIPNNIDDSSLPVAIFKAEIVNKTSEKVKTKLALCMENFLGRGGSVAAMDQRDTFDEGYYHLWDEREGNHETFVTAENGVLFTSKPKEEKRSEGDYFLTSNSNVTDYLLNWDFENSTKNPWQQFLSDGSFPSSQNTVSDGRITASAIAVTCDLEPKQAQEVYLVFSWYTPYFWQAGTIDYSHYYCAKFNSVNDVAKYALANAARLEEESAEVINLLEKSSMPQWLAHSLCNDAYTLTTDSWLTKDGRFSINEGASHMFGCMGTIDQKLYANHYQTLFFSETDKKELLAFARSQGENGGIQHDLGYGHIDQTGQPHDWPDLSSSLTLLSLKHFLYTGDQAYIDEVYPVLVKALLHYQLGMDSDGDLIPNISGVGNTFDAEEFEGTSSYIASLWLAALRALKWLAGYKGDNETADKCMEIFEKAKQNAISELWNGEFFVNYFDTEKKEQCANSHFSQLAGEFFSEFLRLGSCYGHDYSIPACNATLKLNYPASMKAPMNEATPEGEMPTRKLWGWPFHTRIYLAALPMILGMPEKGFETLKRIEDLMAKTDNRWDQRLFFEPESGKQHWGRFYMSSPVTWYVYQTMVGYHYNQPEELLEIIPNLPSDWMPFKGPLFLPSCWLWLEVDDKKQCIKLDLIKQFGDPLTIKKLSLPNWTGEPKITVNGTACEIKSISRTEQCVNLECLLNLDSTIKINWENA
jgi:uncharacterized protein (DUF608 family)